MPGGDGNTLRNGMAAAVGAFRLAEYSAIKAEVAELLKQIGSYLVYAIAISGGVFTWLYSDRAGKGFTNLDGAAVWVPLIGSILLSLLSLASFLRVTSKTAYLRRLESQIGGDDLGYENSKYAHPRMLAWMNWVLWFAIIGGDATVAIIRGDADRITGLDTWMQFAILAASLSISAGFQYGVLSYGASRGAPPSRK